MSDEYEDELTPGTFTPRGEDKGWLGNQIEAFSHMQALGCDVFESAVAVISGHKMTPELAALCIATYWRRYACIASYQESRGAAITLQVSVRLPCRRLPAAAFFHTCRTARQPVATC